MKKILFLLISIPLIFSSCKKEEENQSNNNNNSNLTIHQTIWDVTSYEETIGTNPTTIENIPLSNGGLIGSGISNIRWTFSESGSKLIIKIVEPDGDFETDTLVYSYFPESNIIMIDNLTNTWNSGMTRDQLDINILEHTSNSLTLEQDGYVSDNYQPGNWKFKTYFTKVQ